MRCGKKLNLTEDLPDLKHIPVEFVQLLMLSRELKERIKLKVIGSWIEWDQLDRAVGGAEQPLGRFQ